MSGGNRMNLVIVESGAKAKTIAKYLSSAKELNSYGTFEVVASMGHLVDLPPKDMGIDLEMWAMEYVPISGKGDTIKNIKGLIRRSSMVYLAADPDREGEAIAKNIYDLFGLKKSNTRRVTFNEITKKAVVQAILNPRDIDTHLVDAQEARRILDRLVGYKLSPLLWRRFSSSGLSAGRVQSVALRMIVDRANEIYAFTPEALWQVKGTFEVAGAGAETRLAEEIRNAKETEKLMKELARKGAGALWSVSLSIKESRVSPSAPFVTSTLQQEAYNRHRIPAKRAMQLAQALYEAGHITYMRTDSTALSDDAKRAIHDYVRDRFGDAMVCDRAFKNRVANAQEAHECIRPTNIEMLTRNIETNSKITEEHCKLYDLVWRRAVASQMSAAVYLELKTTIAADKRDMPVLDGRAFEGTVRVLIDRGYLAVWQPDAEPQVDLADGLRRRANEAGAMTARALGFAAEGDMTRPASLYNEPGLVKALEKDGIGRPSTYATIIDKIFSKGYVSRGTNPLSTHRVSSYTADLGIRKVIVEEGVVTIGGKDNDRIVPTSLGKRITAYLNEVAPSMIDVGFTSGMENDLDRISNSELKKNAMLSNFYAGFQELVDDAQKAQKAQREAQREAPGTGATAEKPELRPKNVLRRVSSKADIVQTRYGPAVYVSENNRFLSLSAFMKWKEKTIEDITRSDVAFLLRLPITFSDPTGNGEPYQILLGMYGLYAKQGEKNIRVNQKVWDSIYDGTTSYDDIKAAIVERGWSAPFKRYQKKGARAPAKKVQPRYEWTSEE